MSDYFDDILARLRKSAPLATPVHPHPLTGKTSRLNSIINPGNSSLIAQPAPKIFSNSHKQNLLKQVIEGTD
ncbi:hypothetical protein [Sneathiella sp.]|jgi:hypothetical protein|uniref:hypothetical protein n=1 Tax=Sneathiella sp. TaxID=1964365 RepID=UPI0039E403DF